MPPRFFRVGAALLALLPAMAMAFSLNRNAANIDWRTAETEHFRLRYPKELEGVAGYIAGIAEDRYADKVPRYHMKMPSKVELIIRDDIFSNGWANSVENTMNVWVTDWDFPIRGSHNWLKDVVSHEFSHLVSIQDGAKLPPYIQGVVIGYQDYYNKPVQADFATIIPFMVQPNWFAEGTAQYESERSGGDLWDTHRDMILRVATLNDKLLPIERMEIFTGTSFQYEQGPYTQGFSLTRYVASHYGDTAFVRLWKEFSRFRSQTMSEDMEHVLHKSDRQVYQDWKDSITTRYTLQVQSLGAQVNGQKLTSKGFYNYYPRWDHAGKGLFFVSNTGRDDFRAPIHYLKLADTVKKEEDRLKPISAIRGEFDVARDDSTFLFASAIGTDKNGMHKIDIYQRNVLRKSGFFEQTDPSERRYTRDLNAVNPSYSRDGSRVTFVRAENASFRLCVAPVPDGRELDADSVKTIFPTDSAAEGHYGLNLYTPRFSPDGKQILFSYFDDESRKIGLINADGSGFVPLLDGPHDDRDPEWAPDGKSFFYSSDSTGIFNIYRYDFASRSITALTNVVGGAFAPAVDSSGRNIAYVNYDSNGFSIYLLKDWKPLTQPLAGTNPMRAPSPDIEPMELAGKSEAYLPIPTRAIVTPIIYGEELVGNNNVAKTATPKWLAGVSTYANDPVLKTEVNAALLLQVGNGIDYVGDNDEILSPDQESQLFLSVSNHSTPVTVAAAFSRGNLTTSDSVTNHDVDQFGDSSVEVQNYALTYRDAQVSATYNLFDASAVGDQEQTSFLRLTGGYDWNDFDFYDLGGGSTLDFTYYKSLYLNTLISLYGADYDDKSLVAPVGGAAVVSFTTSQSNLIRNGTFQQTFNISPEGAILPIYRDYDIQDIDAGATYGLAMPWAKHSALVASGFMGSILNWNLKNPGTGDDTLDSFYDKGLFLRGYPYLRDEEHLAFGGENTAMMSLDMNQPLWSDVYKRYWTVFVEDLYADLFWEAGRAWNGPLWDVNLFSPTAWNTARDADGWHQTIGLSFKVNARIYHNYPFLVFLDLDRALSGIPDGMGGTEKISTIGDTPLTQIRFGVAFGLYNGLLGSSARNPMNPRSAFATAP